MDEGDRSGGGDGPDRETGSADSDAGNGDPAGDDFATDDSATDDSATDDDHESDGFAGGGFAGDDPADASPIDGDDKNDSGETVSGEDVESGGETEPVDEDRSEAGQFGVETDRDGTGADRSRVETSRPDAELGRLDAEASRPDAEASRPDAEASRPDAEASRPDAETSRGLSASDEGILYRFRHDREGPLMWIREMLSSVAIVLVIGLLLFGVSGVWPPMVAVESGSMEPNMEVGDLVFVTDPGRIAPDAADNDIGVVTHEVGERTDYRTFGSYGSVVIYRPPERTASPIIHRAMFHVEEGENWYDRADDRYHSAADCGELTHCPAPHDGFVTLGDNNGAYDQANGLAAPVRADWVTGVARVRVPYLGYVRLIATGQAELGEVVATSVAVQAGGVGVDGVSGGDTSDAKATVPDSKPAVSGGDVIAGAAS